MEEAEARIHRKHCPNCEFWSSLNPTAVCPRCFDGLCDCEEKENHALAVEKERTE